MKFWIAFFLCAVFLRGPASAAVFPFSFWKAVGGGGGGGVTVPAFAFAWDFDVDDGFGTTDTTGTRGIAYAGTAIVAATGHRGAGALQVDGSNGCFGKSYHYYDDMAQSGPTTLSVWVKPTTISNAPVIFKDGGGYQASGTYFQVNADGSVSLVTNQSGSAQISSSTAGDVSTGVWTHIVITISIPTVKIYINGVDKTTTSTTHVQPDANPTGGGDGTSFGSYAGGYNALNLTGSIDQYAAWNVVLTGPEIAQLYLDTL